MQKGFHLNRDKATLQGKRSLWLTPALLWPRPGAIIKNEGGGGVGVGVGGRGAD